MWGKCSRTILQNVFDDHQINQVYFCHGRVLLWTLLRLHPSLERLRLVGAYQRRERLQDLSAAIVQLESAAECRGDLEAEMGKITKNVI